MKYKTIQHIVIHGFAPYDRRGFIYKRNFYPCDELEWCLGINTSRIYDNREVKLIMMRLPARIRRKRWSPIENWKIIHPKRKWNPIT